MGGAGGHRGTVGIEVSANGLKQVNLASGLRCFAPFVYPQQFLPWAQVLAAQRPSIAVSAGFRDFEVANRRGNRLSCSGRDFEKVPTAHSLGALVGG